MKKAIKGLSLEMGIASMTADVGATLWEKHKPFQADEKISDVVKNEIRESMQKKEGQNTQLTDEQKKELEERTADILSQLKDITQDKLDQITEVIAFTRTVVFFLGKREKFIYKKYEEKVLSEKEMKRWNISNVPNGLLGMKRDINLKVGAYLDDETVRQLFDVSAEYFMWKNHFLFKNRRIAQMVAQRVDHIYNAVNDYDGEDGNTGYVIKNGLFYISIDLLFRRGTSGKSLFDLFLNFKNVVNGKWLLVDGIFCDSLLRELMRLNGDQKALSASLVSNAMKNGYSLDQLTVLERLRPPIAVEDELEDELEDCQMLVIS
ncbi:MAG: hypothetical protein LBB63_00050, partial [Holosporaceae bacterium]|nr:hypothetical protein [Holosporaceae bacterium]